MDSLAAMAWRCRLVLRIGNPILVADFTDSGCDLLVEATGLHSARDLMKVYLTLEDRVINLPPDEIPEFYTNNKWRLIYSNELQMYVTFPPSPPGQPTAPIPDKK